MNNGEFICEQTLFVKGTPEAMTTLKNKLESMDKFFGSCSDIYDAENGWCYMEINGVNSFELEKIGKIEDEINER